MSVDILANSPERGDEVIEADEGDYIYEQMRDEKAIREYEDE